MFVIILELYKSIFYIKFNFVYVTVCNDAGKHFGQRQLFLNVL